MKTKGSLIVFSGFSGAGKGTLMKKLVGSSDRYALSISMTTRQPRNGEQDGREYFFVTKEQFEEKIAAGGLLEYARYVDCYYGTPKEYVDLQLKAGKDVILEIDVQGAKQIRKKYPDAILMFVMTPSAQILKERLVGRKTETPEKIDQRLKQAVVEAESIPDYDYIIVNDDLEETAARVENIIAAAKNSPASKADFVENFKQELKQL